MYGAIPDEAFACLLPWFAENARDLPWRADREAYHVWVSEIMLQQTRVEAVKTYYQRFLEALPTIQDLASCEEDRLLKFWEGLGYYSRARNLRKAAQTIVADYAGIFPGTYEEILSLSGIGPYTAGAISSISFRQPQAAVDGNVLRVMSRLTDDARDIASTAVKKEVSAGISAYLKSHPQADPGLINQALMELGAIVCVPNGAPECSVCPWRTLCLARKNGTIDERPVRAAKKARRIEQRTILLVTDGEKLLLHRRATRGLLAGMYEPLNLKGIINSERALDVVREMGLSPIRITPAPETKHIFTHIEWRMRGYIVRIEEPEEFPAAVISGDAPLTDTSGRTPVAETSVDASMKEALFFADRSSIGTKYALPSAFRTYMDIWEKTVPE